MTRNIVIIIILAGLTQSVAAQNKPNFWVYSSDPQRQGTLYAYQESDQDNQDKSITYYWFKNETELVSKAWHDNGELWSSVDIVFDWNKMMIHTLSIDSPPKNGTYGNNNITKQTIQNDFGKKKSLIEYSYWTNDKGIQSKRQTIDFRQFPAFFGNLWGREILFAAKYLQLPDGQKASYGSYHTAGYTEFEIWRAGKESIGGVICAKYEFQPVGILGAITGPKGRLWIDEVTGNACQYEFDIALNKKKNYRTTLLSVSKLSEQEWAVFQPGNS